MNRKLVLLFTLILTVSCGAFADLRIGAGGLGMFPETSARGYFSHDAGFGVNAEYAIYMDNMDLLDYVGFTLHLEGRFPVSAQYGGYEYNGEPYDRYDGLMGVFVSFPLFGPFSFQTEAAIGLSVQHYYNTDRTVLNSTFWDTLAQFNVSLRMGGKNFFNNRLNLELTPVLEVLADSEYSYLFYGVRFGAMFVLDI